MADRETELTFTSRRRRELFLQLAAREGGVTVAEIYERARELGDQATEEAYYNIARRLSHRAAITQSGTDGGRTRYVRTAGGEEHWIEEDELAKLVDPDYPVLALTIWRESLHQINEVPEPVWIELRERLAGENARKLFTQAITSYADDFHAQVAELAQADVNEAAELSRLRQEAQDSHRLLVRLTKYGLGLSREALALPASLDVAISEFRSNPPASYVNAARLGEEIERRVEDGPLVQGVERAGRGQDQAVQPLTAGVDGSTRGGLLSVAGEDGDFNVAHSPLVSINTAVGQTNRHMQVGGRLHNVFLRLPERPEDMQRRDNKHTVMAKLLHPDLSDAEYMHAVWNAMDLVETKATARLLRRWYLDPHGVEVPPAEVVLRDGTVTPQDRDFTHYRAQTSYGQIVRDLIEASWDVALTCREDGRVVCGVVKQSQLGFFGPVLNWFAARVAAGGSSQVTAWPLHSMNLIPDQVLVTRLLTAGRVKADPPTRTCAVLRPFHAVTNYGRTYERGQPPAVRILAEYARAVERPDLEDQEDRIFWSNFQGERDAYLKMLDQVQYAGLFLAPVPRLDNDNMLPRLEVLAVTPTDETGPDPWTIAGPVIDKSITVITMMGFEVAAEHSMFTNVPKLDVLPKLLIKTHKTVKTWAQELVGRVQEYVGYLLARHSQGKRLKGLQVRPFTRSELETLYTELRQERERQAGARRLSS